MCDLKGASYLNALLSKRLFTTHIDDILGCREPGILDTVRVYRARRFVVLKLEEANYTRPHAGLRQHAGPSITITQETPTEDFQSTPTSEDMWKQGQRKPGLDETRDC